MGSLRPVCRLSRDLSNELLFIGVCVSASLRLQ